MSKRKGLPKKTTPKQNKTLAFIIEVLFLEMTKKVAMMKHESPYH